MYATARPFEPYSHHTSPLRWLLAILVGLGALLALPPIDRPALPGATHIFAPPRLAKPAGPLSSRLRALTQADWSPTRRGAAIRALGIPPEGFGSLLLDRNGDPLVYITLATIGQPTLDALARAGARVVHISPRYRVVTAALAPNLLAKLAAVPGVLAVQEALARAGREAPGLQTPSAAGAAQPAAVCPAGAIVSDGDTQLRAARARKQFGVDGAGVTVGVLSGSYNVSRAAGIKAENDIASGDLPGPGNPCGYTTPVQMAST
jgi:hypothetical protein